MGCGEINRFDDISEFPLYFFTVVSTTLTIQECVILLEKNGKHRKTFPDLETAHI